jgi:16S rRNA (guanine527-N7)-methyltransferase
MSEQTIISLDPSHVISQFLTKERLDAYFDSLMAENAKVNLVSRETSRASFDRMVGESLLPLTLVDRPSIGYLDIGAGGGWPARPILLSGRASGPAFLCERTKKKALALKKIAVQLGLEVDVLPRDFLGLKPRMQFDLITLRYVKLDSLLLDEIMLSLSPSGVFVYYSESPVSSPKYHSDSRKFSCGDESIIKGFTLFRRS